MRMKHRYTCIDYTNIEYVYAVKFVSSLRILLKLIKMAANFFSSLRT